jgi:predicted nucleic acid-binding protein
MRLVIDTNIIISSLISNSARRHILMNSNIEFISPEYTFVEILKHTDLIKKKAKLAPNDLQYGVVPALLQPCPTFIIEGKDSQTLHRHGGKKRIC